MYTWHRWSATRPLCSLTKCASCLQLAARVYAFGFERELTACGSTWQVLYLDQFTTIIVWSGADTDTDEHDAIRQAQLLRVPTGHRNHLVSDKSTCSLAT